MRVCVRVCVRVGVGVDVELELLVRGARVGVRVRTRTAPMWFVPTFPILYISFQFQPRRKRRT